jgi:hypothetical protein
MSASTAARTGGSPVTWPSPGGCARVLDHGGAGWGRADDDRLAAREHAVRGEGPAGPGVIGWRALQVVAGIAFIACIDLTLKATPLDSDEWNPGRLLYAGSGMATALTLFALAALGIGQRRLGEQLAEIARRLDTKPPRD